MAGNTGPAGQGPPSGLPAGPHPLVLLLQEFTLEANRYVDTAGGQKDMHRTDLNALAVIMRHTEKGNVVTPGLLRKELNLSSPATTALVDRLDHSGHVTRERHGSDRRQVQLKMTPKAFQDGGTIFAPLARHMGTAMAGFTPEELETASRFMTAMVEATVAAREESSAGHPDPGAPPAQPPPPPN